MPMTGADCRFTPTCDTPDSRTGGAELPGRPQPLGRRKNVLIPRPGAAPAACCVPADAAGEQPCENEAPFGSPGRRRATPGMFRRSGPKGCRSTTGISVALGETPRKCAGFRQERRHDGPRLCLVLNGYKKPINALAREIHYEPLPEDMRIVVIRSWKIFGMLPRAAIEKMVSVKELPAPTSV
jgi:hypothetical protein